MTTPKAQIEVAELVNLGAGQQPGSKNDDRPLTPTQAQIEDHPLDTCYCGDYRRDHKDGTGVCIFSLNNSYGDGHGGAGRCDRFRLAHRYEVVGGPRAAAQVGEQDGLAKVFVGKSATIADTIERCAQVAELEATKWPSSPRDTFYLAAAAIRKLKDGEPTISSRWKPGDKELWNEAIERCAQVAESFPNTGDPHSVFGIRSRQIAAAIRKLKDET